MVQLPYLQPFEDVNKRVARIAGNIPFIKHNLAPLSFVDVPERDYVDGLLGVSSQGRFRAEPDVHGDLRIALLATTGSCSHRSLDGSATATGSPCRRCEPRAAIISAPRDAERLSREVDICEVLEMLIRGWQ
jgi:hypothetical protein